MKIRAKIAGCMFTLFLISMFSMPVYAASSEGVVNLAEDSTSDYVGITIDGNYDDWADKPHTQIQYSLDSGNNYHLGALFRDAEYVYLHIKMSPSGYTQFNGYNYRFTTDNKVDYVLAVPPEGTSIVDGNNPLVIRRQNGYHIIGGASGFVTRTAGQPDEWELSIPLSFFDKNHYDQIRTISFYCSNIGPQELIATGTPTLPFLIAGAGLIFAAAGYRLSKRKRNK